MLLLRDGRPGRRQRTLRIHRSTVFIRNQARGPRAHRSRGTRPALARPFPRPSHAAVEPARLEHDRVARPGQRLRRPGSAAPCSRSTGSTWVSSTPIRSASPSSTTTNGSSTVSRAPSTTRQSRDVWASTRATGRLLPPPRLRPLEHAVFHRALLSQRLERRDAGDCRLSVQTQAGLSGAGSVHGARIGRNDTSNGSTPRTIASCATNKSIPAPGSSIRRARSSPPRGFPRDSQAGDRRDALRQ